MERGTGDRCTHVYTYMHQQYCSIVASGSRVGDSTYILLKKSDVNATNKGLVKCYLCEMFKKYYYDTREILKMS
jgi:hypothetical protein